LESLRSQSCRDFELLIQDGASCDATAAVASSFQDALPAVSFVSGLDNGIYDAWNKAASRAKGEWFLFLGADDALYGPDILLRVKDALTSAKANINGGGLSFAAGGVVVVSSENIPLRYISGKAGGVTACLRVAAMPTPFPGLFIHRSLFAADFFDPALKIAGDYDFLCRAWKDDTHALKLPFLVTSMLDGGLSTQKAHEALCCKEKFDSAEKYFSSGWTPENRHHYLRTRILSILYARFPAYAEKFHAMIRKLRGKRPLPVANRPLPPFSPSNTPVFIISFNRLTYLQKLIAWLEKNSFSNIIVVDNNSSYPPLLAYLDALPYNVVRLKENLGHLAIWKCGLFADTLSRVYFIVTDPDILPMNDCPEDVLLQFYNRLIAYPHIAKCGFSLILDDIPAAYPLRESLMAVERPYWNVPLPDASGYFAPIDTTFALYRPGITPDNPGWLEGIRLAPPYAARHLPWYETGGVMDEDLLFYSTATKAESTFWTAVDADSLKRENLELRVRIHELEQRVDMLSQNFSNKVIILVHKILRAAKKKALGE
jgi:glycosyltransferase involved in cell wall biosynthesis